MRNLPSLGGLRGRAPRRVTATPIPIPVPLSAYVVDCAVYVDGKRLPGRWTHTDAVNEVRERGDGFVWIGLHEPDEEQIQGVAETFGLHELAVEDAVHAHQRPKLERYDNTLFMVLKTVKYVQNASPDTANEIVESGEIMVFLGRDFVVTVRHGNHSGLGVVRQVLEDDPEKLKVGPAAVLYSISDHVVDNYLEVTRRIEDDIDQMEAIVFAPRSRVSADQIYLMKREVLELRRAVMPLAVPLRRLAEGYTPLIPEQVRSYFRDVDDHLIEVSDRVTNFDELLTTLVDATLAKITLQQNSDMRKISAWVAIISVPTMVVGVYGMNFENMPELKWKYGYPLVISAVIVACLILYRIFRRNRWL
ncbi:magnesium/cobalt transporter CorA [Umezawaea tangerina]|uniref:Magnesium transport protein CorA n=1 Tax=Umezawaea tangerina TaxID=84725 RepID=A0A2T0TM93_9PSEU|nr:magnesium/cobalt transporter CorA [Umezawaea tangerina]PRY46840.1 magnesium transporter [Umezawaea tangerina]